MPWPKSAPRLRAEALLMRCEAMAGELGLFAEEIDVLRQIFLGNTPR
jgi:GH15 family glucan-1,4-alpha-glucosidase